MASLLLFRPATMRMTVFTTSAVLTTSLLLTSARPTSSTPLLASFFRNSYARCDASAGPITEQMRAYTHEAKTPIVTADGKWNRATIKQLSAGSVAGLVGGVVLGMFSKPLVVVLGIMVFGLQSLQSSLGVTLIPYKRLQRTFTSINFRSLVQDNAAFKLAFGATFALAAFAEF